MEARNGVKKETHFRENDLKTGEVLCSTDGSGKSLRVASFGLAPLTVQKDKLIRAHLCCFIELEWYHGCSSLFCQGRIGAFFIVIADLRYLLEDK